MSDKVFVEIKDCDDKFKKYFGNKDIVSVDELLSAVDQLLYDKEQLEDEINKKEYEDYYGKEYEPEFYE